jgi:hypothetical protein
MNVCDIWRHPHLMKTSGWYECKFSWDRIMKGIEIFVLKSFGIVYVCVKSMVGEWCDILFIHKK